MMKCQRCNKYHMLKGDYCEGCKPYAQENCTVCQLETEQQQLVYDCRDWRIKCESLEAEMALLEQQNNAMRENPNNAALAEHILTAHVLMKNNAELEAKLERLEKAARGVLLDARMGWTTTNCLNELEEALEGAGDE